MESSPHVSIRKATPADAKTLVDLIVELATYENLLDEAEPSVELLEEHLSAEALTGCEALLAETERDTAVGFALSSTTTPPSRPTRGCT